MLSVTFFYREPRKTGVSIEGIFKSVENCLKDRVLIKEFYCNPGSSRVANTLNARKHTSDINHITGDVNFLLIGLAGKRNILTIHDLGFYENPVHSAMVKFVYRLFWFTLPLKCTSIVTVVSHFTKNKLIQHFGFPEARIRVVPDPVKPVFRYTPKEQMSEKPVVLMLGSGKHKNLDNLIAAAKDIPVHLDIVGWPAPDEIERLNSYGISHTIYNGLTDEEVFNRYIACDILFIASFYEGFGMPIIEAQCVGRPVITSNLGAMAEVGRGTTMLVDPHKPEEIREAILTLNNRKLYDDLIARGRQNAAKYSHEIIAEQYLEVYKELAAK